jgi:hypothetical protein
MLMSAGFVGRFIGVVDTMSASNCRTVTCPLAQSAEHLHDKKDLRLFSSSGDQQEQPFMQVDAHRSIWIK